MEGESERLTRLKKEKEDETKRLFEERQKILESEMGNLQESDDDEEGSDYTDEDDDDEEGSSDYSDSEGED